MKGLKYLFSIGFVMLFVATIFIVSGYEYSEGV